MGGLSKKAFQIDTLVTEYALPSLLLDGGNLLFKPEESSPELIDQEKITAMGIARAYGLIGYDGVAVGGLDLFAGINFLEAVQEKTSLPLLSANLLCAKKNRPLFTPYRIVRKGSLSIGIIGLTGDDSTVIKAIKDNGSLVSWRDVLPDIVAEISSQCDLIAVLSNYHPAENQAMAREIAGIHLIVQSGGSPINMEPVQEGNTLILQTGKQGKYLGWLQVDWQKSRQWGKETAHLLLQEKKQELDGAEARLTRYRKRLTADELAANEGYAQLLASRDTMAAEIERGERELLDRQQSGLMMSTYSNTFIAMETKLPDEPRILALVEKIKQDSFEAGRKKSGEIAGSSPAGPLESDSPTLAPYVGWGTCSGCHGAQTAFWQSTGHSRAFRTLEEKSRQYDMNCLACHVTPEKKFLKDGNDHVLLALPEELRPIGCETCHGPGLVHSRTSNSIDISRKPAEHLCLRCHTPDQDDDFNYARDVGLVGCPGDGR